MKLNKIFSAVALFLMCVVGAQAQYTQRVMRVTTTLDGKTNTAYLLVLPEGMQSSTNGVITITLVPQHAINSDTASNAVSSGYATNAGAAASAVTAGFATSSSYATNAGTATFATTAGTAGSATSAGTATFAVSANYATNSGYSVSSGYATNAGNATSLGGTPAAQYATTNLVNTTSNTLAAATLAITNGLPTAAITNGLALNLTIVPWDGTLGTQTVQLAQNNIYWYSNNVSVNQLILVSNAVAGGWADVGGRATNTLAPTVTLNCYTATTNWLTGIWSGWSTGKYDRLGIDCLSTAPTTNLTLGFKEQP